MKEKKWEILEKGSKMKNRALRNDSVLQLLFENRGLKTKKEIDLFLHADLELVTPKTVGIDSKQLAKAIHRIRKAIEKKEQIVVFGDYDVDGITGTAILWEILHGLGAMAIPYIPNRIDEGYGLSIKGIENLTTEVTNVSLIITVDNGIVANEAVRFAKEKGIDVIITDHHTVGEKLPEADAIVHTTQICGAAVGYMLSQEFIKYRHPELDSGSRKKIPGQARNDEASKISLDHLSLVALATVADLVPLTGASRVLLREGLKELHKTTRVGLLALFKEAQIEKETIGVYEIGHIIAPRLNAMGRLESAMDSLRLLYTKDRIRAMALADTLSRTNRERQLLTQSAATHAIEQFRVKKDGERLLFIAHDEYDEGIIGLVAGKLVEEYYLPAIVLSKGEIHSKASARSIAGFNIIEFIRAHADLLINAGGHPMAAGFTVETEKIIQLQEALEKLAKEQVKEDLLQRVIKIDCEIPLGIVTDEFYQLLQQLAPFGMGNPEPTFVSEVVVKDFKTVGKDKQHLKLKVGTVNRHSELDSESRDKKPHPNPLLKGEGDQGRVISIDAIAFGQGDRAKSLKIGGLIDIVYTIAENTWNGKRSLQLKIKDIK